MHRKNVVFVERRKNRLNEDQLKVLRFEFFLEKKRLEARGVSAIYDFKSFLRSGVVSELDQSIFRQYAVFKSVLTRLIQQSF